MSGDPYDRWAGEPDQSDGYGQGETRKPGQRRRFRRGAQATDSWPGGPDGPREPEEAGYADQDRRGHRDPGGRGSDRYGGTSGYSRADDYGRADDFGRARGSGRHRDAADYGASGYPDERYAGEPYAGESYADDGYGGGAYNGGAYAGGADAGGAYNGDAYAGGAYNGGAYAGGAHDSGAHGDDAYGDQGYQGSAYGDGYDGRYAGQGPPDISNPGVGYPDTGHVRGSYPADNTGWESAGSYGGPDQYGTDPYGGAGDFREQGISGHDPGYGGPEGYDETAGYGTAGQYPGQPGQPGQRAGRGGYAERADYAYGGGYDDQGTGPVRRGTAAAAGGAGDGYDWQAPVDQIGLTGGLRGRGRGRDGEPELNADDPRHNGFFRGFNGGEDDGFGHGRPRKQKRRKSKAGMVALSILVLFVVAVVGAGVYGYHWYTKRHADWTGSTGYGSVVVKVAPGEFACSAALENTLVGAGVVASAQAFCTAAKANTSGRSLEPGYFKLHKHMGAALAWALLLNPKSRDQLSVTVPDGLRASKVIARLAAQTGIPLSKFQAALNDTSALGLPSWAKGNPEGFLWPATYPIDPGASALGILKTMVHQFNSEMSSINLTAGARHARFTKLQVITAASILEGEVGPKYYGKVAMVIDNRLNQVPPWKLQVDSTVAYATNNYVYNNLNTSVNSPYNTFEHAGLPPGPIDSPDAAAIHAVLHPVQGGWLYFVTVNKSGLTKFTTSSTQFTLWSNEAKAAGV